MTGVTQPALNNQIAPCDQALGKDKLPLTGINLQQNQAQGQAQVDIDGIKQSLKVNQR